VEAFSCVALNAVLKTISLGVAQVIVGVAFSTLSDTLAVAVTWFVVSAGVKVTDNVWVPAFSGVSAAGV
jgi:hypothetical protein